jgi:hypothetical protein
MYFFFFEINTGAFLYLNMTNSDYLMVISDDGEESDEDEFRLYIDENVFDSIQQSTKSTNTGNPFELDWSFITNIHRYQTRSVQTILTSDTNLLLKRHRSTSCQAEFFATMTKETNTNYNDEERIPVVKKQRIENVD